MALQKLTRDGSQIILNGPMMSGRGVRFRMLDPQEKRDADQFAIGQMPKEAHPAVIYAQRMREGVKRFLTEVTDNAGLQNLDGADIVWHKVSDRELSDPTSDYYITSPEFLTARDIDFLTSVYSEMHEVRQTEFDAIMGKAMKVSAGSAPSTGSPT